MNHAPKKEEEVQVMHKPGTRDDSPSARINVKPQDIVHALQYKLSDSDIPPNEIERIANYVLNFFGYGETTLDNFLTPEDRDIFYTLEENGLVSAEREETYMLRGKTWRIHYWVLKKMEILHFAKLYDEAQRTSKDDARKVYDREEVWKRK